MRKISLVTTLAVSLGLSPMLATAQVNGDSNPFEKFRTGGSSSQTSDLKNYGDQLFGESKEASVRSAQFDSSKDTGSVTPTSAFGGQSESVPEFSPSRVSLPAPTTSRNTFDLTPRAGAGLNSPVATTPTAASIRPTSIKNAAPTNVTAEWQTEGVFNVGQECVCKLVVTNTGSGSAADVTVETHFPTSARLIKATPKPQAADAFLTWSIGTLPAGASKTIEVVLVPSQQGDFQPSAHVRHTSTAVAGFQVLEPMLKLAISGPSQVSAGDPASQVVTITNPGTGVATNVFLEAVIPQGLEHARGGKLRTDLGNLNPGETRSVRLALAAVSGGDHVLQVGAKADAGLSQAATSTVKVVAPSLISSVEGPGLRYLGRDADYTISITNDGAATSENVRVMHKLPSGFDYVKSTRGAKYDRQSRMVSWFVGRLDRGQTVQLGLTLAATKAGAFTHLVRATSDQGVVSDSQVTTRVEGVSALAVSVADLDDPVEVGAEAAYSIEIKNEGSAPASNVALVCELPLGTTFKSAKGPSRHAEAAGKIIFQPLATIAPGQTVTYQVQAAGDQPGMKRFRATISSDATESLISEEVTRFYGE